MVLDRSSSVVARKARIFAAVVALAVTNAALATNHIVQFDEVMAGANGDSRVQFVEIKFAGGQNLWGPQGAGQPSRAELAFFDATGAEVGVFEFPSDPPQIPGTQDPNTPGLFSALMATQEFANATGLAPDFIIPADVINRAGKVCFRDNVSPFVINLCVSYGDNAAPDVDNGLIPYVGAQGSEGPPAAALPITNAQSLQRFQNFTCQNQFCHANADFQLTAPAPRNTSGATAVINVASTLDQGETIFFQEPFLGNGRSCATCHAPSDGFGLNPSTIAALPPTDLLFIAELALTDPDIDPSLANLENPCLMRGGRSLILENVHGFGANPVFRTSPHLMNIVGTAPYGWSPAFGGANDLIEFCQGAVKQHFPKFLPRNFDPNNGPMSQRTGTVEELTFMEEFQNSIKTQVGDGLGDLTNNREENLDRLIAAFVACNSTPTQTDIDTGRSLFSSAGCSGCHSGPFLGAPASLATGVVNHPSNADDGCQGGPGDPTVPLPNEDVECAGNPACNPPLGEMQFDTRPLVDIARVRENFFHAGEAADLRESVEFYTSSAFENSVNGFQINLTSTEIDQIVAFLTAIVETPPCEGACCLPDGTCQIRSQAACEAVCGVFNGPGTNCNYPICPTLRLGACCMSDGSCTETRGECLCDQQGGEFQGPSTNCVGANCPQPGACCLPDATCQVIPKEECLDQCGSFEGEGTDCSMLDQCCVDLPRACCLPDGTCTEVSKCECGQLGGDAGDTGSSCADTDCPAPGACCLPDGPCIITTKEECEAICGTFQGDNSVCGLFCLSSGRRACCLPNGSCVDTTPCECERDGGTVTNGLCSLIADQCPEPTGACCMVDGRCVDDVTKEQCTEECGVYRGDGSVCLSHFCPVQLPQACCLPNRTCRNLDPCICRQRGGRPRGVGTNCGNTSCFHISIEDIDVIDDNPGVGIGGIGNAP